MIWLPGVFNEGIDRTPNNLFVESSQSLLCNLSENQTSSSPDALLFRAFGDWPGEVRQSGPCWVSVNAQSTVSDYNYIKWKISERDDRAN